MKNYISINDQKIELTEDQVKRIVEAYGVGRVLLADVPAGELVKIGAHEFIVLEQSGDTTAVIRKELLPDTVFGSSNNYNGSKVEAECNKFAEDIAAIVGEENVVLHSVDLTSNDGLKDYGKVKRRASLLTADLYRRYVEILDKFNPKNWWWLSTPYSTKKHDNDVWVLCVAPSGYFDSDLYDCIGVRPFCILKSNIFVSV